MESACVRFLLVEEHSNLRTKSARSIEGSLTILGVEDTGVNL